MPLLPLLLALFDFESDLDSDVDLVDNVLAAPAAVGVHFEECHLLVLVDFITIVFCFVHLWMQQNRTQHKMMTTMMRMIAGVARDHETQLTLEHLEVMHPAWFTLAPS